MNTVSVKVFYFFGIFFSRITIVRHFSLYLFSDSKHVKIKVLGLSLSVRELFSQIWPHREFAKLNALRN